MPAPTFIIALAFLAISSSDCIIFKTRTIVGPYFSKNRVRRLMTLAQTANAAKSTATSAGATMAPMSVSALDGWFEKPVTPEIQDPGIPFPRTGIHFRLPAKRQALTAGRREERR